jgi:hypothetical protein
MSFWQDLRFAVRLLIKNSAPVRCWLTGATVLFRTRQRLRRNASRKAGLVVSDSARALNIREPTFAASAQCGIRPQR